MKRIDLKRVPNQEILFENGDNRWDITIKTAIRSIVVDVELNGVLIVSGRRILEGMPFIVDATHRQAGNFVIAGIGELWWERFGDTQHLYFTSRSLNRETFSLLSDDDRRRVH